MCRTRTTLLTNLKHKATTLQTKHEHHSYLNPQLQQPNPSKQQKLLINIKQTKYNKVNNNKAKPKYINNQTKTAR